MTITHQSAEDYGTPGAIKLDNATHFPLPEWIQGLELQWVSASAVTVGTGSAYVESLGYVIRVSSPIALTGLSLGNSAWGYVYLKSDGTAECNTTAPTTAYAGSARSKTGDSTRRFLGTVRTNSSGDIYRFKHVPTSGTFRYVAETSNGDFLIISGGSATTATDASAAAIVPPQSRTVHLVAYQLNSFTNTYLGSGSGDYTITTSLFEEYVSPGDGSGISFAGIPSFVSCDSAQNISYITTAGGNLYVHVRGYILER